MGSFTQVTLSIRGEAQPLVFQASAQHNGLGKAVRVALLDLMPE